MEEITKEEKELLILKDKLELVINKTEKPSSYEFGKPGSRFKIYFGDVGDLKKQLDQLVKEKLATKEDFEK